MGLAGECRFPAHPGTTGLLCTFPNREKPVFITGIPAGVNRFFPVWEKYTGKTLFWPCTGPVRDCSVGVRNNSDWGLAKLPCLEPAVIL